MGAGGGYLTNIGRGVSFDDRNLKIPRTYEYSFGIERELPYGMVVEASYVGSKTVHDTFNDAQFDSYASFADFQRAQNDPNYLNRSLPNPFFGILPSNSTLGAATAVNATELRRPFPGFNSVDGKNYPWARYRFDSLQVRTEKRVLGSRDHGILTVVVAYTFSKSFEQNHRLNDWNFNEPGIHELSNLDKPQSVAFSGVWDLPIGKGRRFMPMEGPIGGALLNGWSFDWILTYASGYPVAKPDAVFSCGDYRVAGQTQDHWYNNDPKCYADRPPFTLRSAEDRFPNIRNPSAPQLNVALQKSFKISERFSFQLRGESFNVTNTPIFPGPASSDYRNPLFGRLNPQQQNFPRLVQLAGKFLF